LSIPSWAVKGAKIVCVDSQSIDGGSFYLTNGKVYEVVTTSAPFVRVIDDRGKLGGWHISHFRPLVTRSQEQDIAEHFAGHLHQRVPEKA
jgi:hypothetical protein